MHTNIFSDLPQARNSLVTSLAKFKSTTGKSDEGYQRAVKARDHAQELLVGCEVLRLENFLCKALIKDSPKCSESVQKYTSAFTQETKDLGKATDWKTSVEPNLAGLATEKLKQLCG